jgi:O-antigen/teichoic acid export membrane protein
MSQFYSFMIAPLDNALIGNFRVATNFGVLLTFVTIPISTVLFPAFSKLNPKNDLHLLRTMFASSVKYSALLLVPATMALMVLANPIVGTLYGDKWPYAPSYLSLGIIVNMFVLFGHLIIGVLLSAVGETMLMMKMNMLTLSIGVPLAFIIIPQFGINGAILGLTVCGLPSLFLGLRHAWKHYGIKVDYRASGKIFLASTVATLITFLFLSIINAAYWMLLVTGLLLFLVVYLTITPLIGAINQTDIANLRTMFSNLGVISKLLEIPLRIFEMSLKIRVLQTKKVVADS